MARPGLNREDIESGRIEASMTEAARRGLVQLRSPEERERSRTEILAAFPPGDGIWVFCYGSLIWNPMFEFAERRPGTVYGYHRRFCLWTALGRGSPECRCLVLGLDRGGSCQGLVCRIPAARVEAEIKLLWDREVVGDAYTPKILKVRSQGETIPAVSFVMDRHSQAYAGRLDNAEIASFICRAEGWLGTCRDYLFNTVDHLAEVGLQDHHLAEIARLVRRQMKL